MFRPSVEMSIVKLSGLDAMGAAWEQGDAHPLSILLREQVELAPKYREAPPANVQPAV